MIENKKLYDQIQLLFLQFFVSNFAYFYYHITKWYIPPNMNLHEHYDGCHNWDMICLPFRVIWYNPRFWSGFVKLIGLFFYFPKFCFVDCDFVSSFLVLSHVFYLSMTYEFEYFIGIFHQFVFMYEW